MVRVTTSEATDLSREGIGVHIRTADDAKDKTLNIRMSMYVPGIMHGL